MSKLVHNEQVKLFATFCNNVAVACLAAGFIGPIVALFTQHPEFFYSWKFLLFSPGSLIAVAPIHLIGKWSLRRLQE